MVCAKATLAAPTVTKIDINKILFLILKLVEVEKSNTHDANNRDATKQNND
ncbi:MAG: hypothetical protein QOI04_1376 [Verrucomicrobiota bacterium]